MAAAAEDGVGEPVTLRDVDGTGDVVEVGERFEGGMLVVGVVDRAQLPLAVGLPERIAHLVERVGYRLR